MYFSGIIRDGSQDFKLMYERVCENFDWASIPRERRDRPGEGEGEGGCERGS